MTKNQWIEKLTEKSEEVGREEAVRTGFDMTQRHALLAVLANVLANDELRREAIRRTREEYGDWEN